MFLIGTASYKSREKLHATIEHLRAKTTGEWSLFIVDNSPADDPVREYIRGIVQSDARITAHFNETNNGYAGAVNQILERARATPGLSAVAYVDNDAYVETPRWNEHMLGLLGCNLEIGIVFPNGGAFQIPANGYSECLWGVGFCWVLRREAFEKCPRFDETIGHQEEVDYQTQLRLAGFKIACMPNIKVRHDATSTKNPEAQERIRQGVVRWVDKWNRYFYGANQNYHSADVRRHEDWPPSSLYLQRYWQQHPDTKHLNANPREMVLNGTQYDLIVTPRFKNFYRSQFP